MNIDIAEIAKKSGLAPLSHDSWYIKSPEVFEQLIKTIITEHEKQKWSALVNDLRGHNPT